MVIDTEIKKIMDLQNTNINVNQYTINYDNNTKRFFKAFGPKALGGGAASVVAFAGLGAATLLTGGLGLGIGAIAGISVAFGAGASAIYSGVQYRDYHSKTRFKNMGIDATIEFIKSMEAKEAEYDNMLQLQPNTKEFTIDGKKASRRLLKKVIKENTSIAYAGLKYVLNQGLIVSDQINLLLNKQKEKGLSESEEEALNEHYKIMDKIASCTQYMARQRKEYNPYKGLIIDNIQKGCLLGATAVQNEQIRLLSKSKDQESAVKQYSNMYETAILNEERDTQRKIFKNQQRINIEHRRYNEILDDLIARGKITQEMMRANGQAVQEVESKVITVALIAIAEDLLNKLPKMREFNQIKEDISTTLQALKQANFKYNDEKIKNKEVSLEEMKNLQISLDTLVEQAQTQYEEYLYAKGQVEGQQEVQQVFDDYKVMAEARRKRILNRANTIIGIRKGQVEDLTQKLDDKATQLDEVQNEFEIAATGYYETDKKLQYQKKENERLKQQVDSHSKHIVASNKRFEAQKTILENLGVQYRARGEELKNAYADLDESSKQVAQATRLAMAKETKIKKLLAEVQQLVAEVESVKTESTEVQKKNRALTYQQLLTNGELKTVRIDLDAKTKKIDELLAEVDKLSQENTEWMRATTKIGSDYRKLAGENELVKHQLQEETEKHQKATAHVREKVGENQGLQQQVNVKESSIKVLQSQLDEEIANVSKLKATLQNAEQEAQNDRKKANEYATQLNAAREYAENLNTRIAKLEDKLDNSKLQSDKARRELQQKIASLRKERDKLATVVDQLTVENKAQIRHITSMGYDLRDASEQIEQLTADNTRLTSKHKKATAYVEEKVFENQGLQQQVDEQDDLIAVLQGRIKKGDENLSREIAARQTAEQEAKKARGEVVEVRTQLNKAEVENAKKGSKINSLEDSLRTSREQVSVAREEQRRLSKKASELTGKNEELTTEVANQQQTIQSQGRLIADMGYDLHKAQTERDDARKAQRELEDAVDELCGTISMMSEELAVAQEEYAQIIAQRETKAHLNAKKKPQNSYELEKQKVIERLQKNIRLVKTFAKFIEENYSDYNRENIAYVKDWVRHWTKNDLNECSLESLNSMINTWQNWFNRNLHNLPQVTIDELKNFFEEEGYEYTPNSFGK